MFFAQKIIQFFFVSFALLSLSPLNALEGKASSKIYSKHWPAALPVKSFDKNPIILHDIFILQFDLKKRLAVFLAYFLSPQIVWGSSKQERTYVLDPFLNEENSLSYKDYKGAGNCDKKGRKYGYDKGHLAPLGSFKASAYAYQAQYMSNIAPQKSNLNQGPWREFEERVRAFVKTGREVQILTGPVYGRESKKTAPCWKAAQSKISELPESYFKIVLNYKRSKFFSCSVIMPQTADRRAHPKIFEVKIQKIESQTGLDILSQFTDKKKITEDCSFFMK